MATRRAPGSRLGGGDGDRLKERPEETKAEPEREPDRPPETPRRPRWPRAARRCSTPGRRAGTSRRPSREGRVVRRLAVRPRRRRRAGARSQGRQAEQPSPAARCSTSAATTTGARSQGRRRAGRARRDRPQPTSGPAARSSTSARRRAGTPRARRKPRRSSLSRPPQPRHPPNPPPTSASGGSLFDIAAPEVVDAPAPRSRARAGARARTGDGKRRRDGSGSRGEAEARELRRGACPQDRRRHQRVGFALRSLSPSGPLTPIPSGRTLGDEG